VQLAFKLGEARQGLRKQSAVQPNIESFAAQHQSVINVMPVEVRVYFVRSR
jgi:hypothetical protein